MALELVRSTFLQLLSGYVVSCGLMEKEQKTREELIEEIQHKVAYLLSTDDFTVEEKEAIARKFLQALEAGE